MTGIIWAGKELVPREDLYEPGELEGSSMGWRGLV